ncbi:MAG: type II toxin-antitoxin system VapC family toxin [Acidobacteriota bacterium]|nr:type II toxin-antitoxin system VapC family toxin [Acidobacteriota bacterium]
MIHLDSSFLIDLHREIATAKPGEALDLIESFDPAEVLGVSVHVLCELRAGAELSRHAMREHEALDELSSGLQVVYPDERFAPLYARLLAATTRGGRPVAAMDLLIATAATLHDAPLVTRNVKDFSRVPGLRVLKY